MTQPAAASKNRYGVRVYNVPRPGSLEMVELPSVTALLKVVSAPNLEQWKQRIVAEQLAKRPDLIMLAANPETRRDAVKQALDSTYAASNIGTSIHWLTEMCDSDDPLLWELCPEVSKPWVNNYMQGREDFGWTLVKKEFTTYRHDIGGIGYAGTADRFLRIPGYDGVVVADVKTGSGIFPDHGTQMSFYAYADGIWEAPAETPKTDAATEQLQKDIAAKTNIPKGRRGWSQAAVKAEEARIVEEYWDEYASLGTHVSMPEDLRKDIAFVMHLREDKFELVPLDISGMDDVITSICHLNRFQKRRDVVGERLIPGRTPTSAPPTESSDPLQSKAAEEGIKIISADDAKAILAKAETQGTAVPEPTEEEIQAGDDFQPEPPTSIPVAPEAPRETRVQVYRDRIAALSTEAKQKLAFNWPANVPTLKQSSDQTEEQLAIIDKLLWELESEFPPSSEETQAALGRLSNAFAA